MTSTTGVRIEAHGGPEALQWGPVELAEPGPSDLVVRLEAAGVNFIDIYQRSGLYQLTLPAVLGIEGAGTVTSVGADVQEFAVGDRVAWLDAPGSYAHEVVVPAARAVPVPEGVATDVAAAVMLQGCTAHYLVTDTFPLRQGQVALIHAAAGGVGLLLVQLAAAAGARVIGTVGSAEKADLAKAAGAHDVVLTTDDLVPAIEALVGPRAVDVAYDGVGKATFDADLALLRRRGMLVSFGNASGPVDPISPLVLMNNGSLYLTRPTLFHYVDTTEELRVRAGAVLGMVASGALDVRIGTRLSLGDAAEAHRLLEQRRTTGKVLLLP